MKYEKNYLIAETNVTTILEKNPPNILEAE